MWIRSRKTDMKQVSLLYLAFEKWYKIAGLLYLRPERVQIVIMWMKLQGTRPFHVIEMHRSHLFLSVIVVAVFVNSRTIIIIIIYSEAISWLQFLEYPNRSLKGDAEDQNEWLVAAERNRKFQAFPEENEAQEVRFTRKPPFVCQINWQKVEKFDFMRTR